MATVCTEHMSKHGRFVAALRCFSHCSGNDDRERRIDHHLMYIDRLEGYVKIVKDSSVPIPDEEYDIIRQILHYECAEWMDDYEGMLDADVQDGYDFRWDTIDTEHDLWFCKNKKPHYRCETILDMEEYIGHRQRQIEGCRSDIAYAKDSSIEGFRIMTETFEKA